MLVCLPAICLKLGILTKNNVLVLDLRNGCYYPENLSYHQLVEQNWEQNKGCFDYYNMCNKNPTVVYAIIYSQPTLQKLGTT